MNPSGLGPEDRPDPGEPEPIPYVDLPLPGWCTALRAHQIPAVEQILAAFDQGARIVAVDAPTGSGKTLLGELTRRMLAERAVYVCSDIGLQEQVLRDFSYGALIKGRARYPTEKYPGDFPHLSADDCEGDCRLCHSYATCPYVMAKAAAREAQLAIANTSYWLLESNGVGHFSEQGLIVVDEADRLEQAVVDVVGVELDKKFMKTNKLAAPEYDDGIIIGRWLTNAVIPRIVERQVALDHALAQLHPRDTVRRAGVKRELVRMRELDYKLTEASEELPSGAWVMCRTGGGGVAFKPVSVVKYGTDYVWRHATRWLLMSATLLRPRAMVRDLGGGDIPMAVVRVPSTFPARRRPIYALGTVPITYQTEERVMPQVLRTLAEIIRAYPSEKILVHTFSYRMMETCRARFGDDPRAIWAGRGDRAAALERFRSSTAGVLFAASFDRGLDLPDDACRVVVVVKMPFPSTIDPYIAAKLKQSQEWYSTHVLRTLIQQTGRAMRHQGDWAAHYVIDAKLESVLDAVADDVPGWWRDALVYPMRGTPVPVFGGPIPAVRKKTRSPRDLQRARAAEKRRIKNEERFPPSPQYRVT